MDLRETEWVRAEWIHLAQDTDQWWANVNTEIGGEFLDSTPTLNQSTVRYSTFIEQHRACVARQEQKQSSCKVSTDYYFKTWVTIIVQPLQRCFMSISLHVN
jgi:hypothetical protein